MLSILSRLWFKYAAAGVAAQGYIRQGRGTPRARGPGDHATLADRNVQQPESVLSGNTPGLTDASDRDSRTNGGDQRAVCPRRAVRPDNARRTWMRARMRLLMSAMGIAALTTPIVSGG